MQALGLVRYDEMCRAVEECARVDEAKDIRDKALALEKYMAQAENLEAERLACNVRLRAERRCGQLLQAMKASGERASVGGDGRNQHGGSSNPSTTLSDLGVSRDQASRFQQLADVPQDEFEAALAEPDKPSTAGVLRRHREPAVDPMDANALWLWGRLRDFEQKLLELDPRTLVLSMTPAMQDDVRRLAPRVARYLDKI